MDCFYNCAFFPKSKQAYFDVLEMLNWGLDSSLSPSGCWAGLQNPIILPIVRKRLNWWNIVSCVAFRCSNLCLPVNIFWSVNWSWFRESFSVPGMQIPAACFVYVRFVQMQMSHDQVEERNSRRWLWCLSVGAGGKGRWPSWALTPRPAAFTQQKHLSPLP